MNLLELPWRVGPRAIRCVVETPRGSRSKLKYDPKLGLFTLSRSLNLGLSYPYDWGFIPETAGVDGDPLDVMMLHESATYPGVILTCELIGGLQIRQQDANTEGRNDRYFATPVQSRREAGLDDVQQLPERLRRELAEFFLATTRLEDKRVEVAGWIGPDEALKRIEEGAREFVRRRS